VINFGVFALLWPFFAVAVAVVSVLAFHRMPDRHSQQQHPAE
jgi:hypothetical protein